MNYVAEVPLAELKDLSRFFYHKDKRNLSGFLKPNQFATGSGKAALSLALSYLKFSGALESKIDRVLVPEWLGYWVYNQINEHAAITFSVADAAKVILVYHQYGFPQNMAVIQDYAESIGARIIEDYAHTLWLDRGSFPASSNDNLLIHSFSKFFFCFSLGAVTGQSDDFKKFASENLKNGSFFGRLFIDFTKFMNEYSRAISIELNRKCNYLNRMAYSVYGLEMQPSNRALYSINEEMIMTEIELRKERFQIFKTMFREFDVDQYLPDTEVCPYVIPLIFDEEKLLRINQSLRSQGFLTGIYHFDVNRNLLSPNFTKCVWLLNHSGIDRVLFEKQISIILGCLRR